MFEQFSSGYYLGRLYVQTHDGDRAVMRSAHHDLVRRQLYGGGSTADQTGRNDPPANPTADGARATGPAGPTAAPTAPHETTETPASRGEPTGAPASPDDPTPLVMRFEHQHFVVDGEEGVPERTLVVPGTWLDRSPDPLEPREVFLAKADRATQLLRFAVGGDPTAGEGTGGGQGDGSGGPDDGGDGATPSGGTERSNPAASPFVPRALGDVARPGWRHQ